MDAVRDFVRRRRWWVVAGVAAALILATWALWPEPEPESPPRARQYLEFTACLLTDDKGLNGERAKPVWDGMQEASLDTHAKVQYLQVAGEQTAENAATFVASLAQTKCSLIFAAGDVPAAGVRRTAPSFPNVRFYLVGETNPGGNVSSVDGSSPQATQVAVKRILTEAAKGQR